VSVARSFVRDTLGEADPDEQDTALLLASELVTNAILHARTPVELGIVVDGDTALVCVADRLAGGGPLAPRGHSQVRSGGRGLALVDDLSDRWGTETHTGGKTVWFTLSVSVGSVRAG
jgi:anti-sigma regulatory factor (Ser/Thr protein kinase)